MIGKIISINDNIIEVVLSDNNVSIGNILCLESNENVLFKVVEISNTSLKCIPYKKPIDIKKGSTVKKYSDTLEVEYSKKVFGRIMDSVLMPIDEEELNSTKKRSTENNSPILQDISLEENPLWTGIKMVDFFTPINYGDKVSIIGNTKSGKTTLLNKLLINIYKVSNAKSIYLGLSSPKSEIMDLYDKVSTTSHLDDIALIHSSTDDNALSKITSLESATTIAEFERNEDKKDSLVFVDNINKYIDALKELNDGSIKSNITHILERLDSIKGKSITTFMTMLNNEDANIIKKDMDACIVLNNEIIDYINSTSKKVDSNIIGERHYNLILKVKEVLKRSNELKSVIDILGMDELSSMDKKIVNESKRLTEYFKLDDNYTEIDTILDNVEDILNDSLPEVGTYGNI